MRFSKQKKTFVKGLCGCLGVLWLFGCQHSIAIKTAELQLPVQLKLKGRKGRTDIVVYHTESAIKTISSDKIARNKIETTDFTTRTETLEVKDGKIMQAVTVTQKEGDMNLHDMAFPEFEETLPMTYTQEGAVIQAGDFAKDGIFYVPRISLPERPVKIGDSWKMKADWMSAKNQIKMRLDLVTTFKRVVPCGKDSCADLEVSGEVVLPDVAANVLNLKSRLVGRIFFAIGEGTEVWSEIRNMEAMSVEGVSVSVEACLESVLREPEYLQVRAGYQPDCQVPFNEELTVPEAL